jgi:V/A-type H+-transporting ATPase subunit I
MSIVALKKVSLCGVFSDKTLVLKELQALGLAHLIPFQSKDKALISPEMLGVDKALIALKYLQAANKKRHQVRQELGFDFNATITEILAVRDSLLALSEQCDFLEERIKEVALWGDFTLVEEGELSAYRLWFYRVPKQLMKEVKSSELTSELTDVTHPNDISIKIVGYENT